MSKDMEERLGLVIIGGGVGGLALLRLFHGEKSIEVMGVVDVRPEAPAVKHAKSLNIPTTTDFRELIKRDGVNIIADVTANDEVRKQILKEKRPDVELIGGISARLMWDFTVILERRVEERTREIKQLQEELLKNKIAILQELSSGVSHKLQNPLTAIKNSTHYLLSNVNDYPKMKKHLEIIDREIQVTEETIKDLVDLVKPGETIFSSMEFDKDKSDDTDFQRQLIQSEKLAGIGIIAAGIAHEVSNPLSVMLGRAEMILEEEDMASIRKYAEDILKYAKKASEIVAGVTFYSRAAWAPGGRSHRINVNDQLNEALKISKLSKHFDNVEVLKDYQDVPLISGNTGEIHQCFTNLMRNAAQAMKGRGRLYLKSQYEDGSVMITIKDTGPGIKKEHLDKLFTPFFTTKDPGKGTGLGLNIVHKIVTNHAGTINVKSEEGKGAAFILRFPKSQESAERSQEQP